MELNYTSNMFAVQMAFWALFFFGSRQKSMLLCIV